MKIRTLPIARAFKLCFFLNAAQSFGLMDSSTAGEPGLKSLAGHVPAAVANLAAYDDLPATNRLNLAIGLPLRDPKGLQAFLADLYNPASPHYRHYLTPEQFAEWFGPSADDYAAVIAFARQNNFKVTVTNTSRLVLDVNAAAADVQQAFHIRLRQFHHPTEARDFFAPDSEPSVNATLAIADISGLNNYALPRPMSLHKAQPAAGAANARPWTGSGSGGAYLGKDFRAAYVPGVSLTGTGQTIGVFEFDGYYPSDLAAYESAAGLSPVPMQLVLLDEFDGTPSSGADSGNVEVSLDITLALSMAPGVAGIYVFEAGPGGLQNDILSAMASSNQVKQFSCSWGWGGGPSGTTDAIFQQLASQGQSFFQASGDSDAYTTGASSTNGVDNLSLFGAPSSSPYITVVGGTTLSTTGPVGSWVSETVWNSGLLNGHYVGSSGGISSYYGIPSWQASVSMAANSGSTVNRNIPDVAMLADNVYVYFDDGSSQAVVGTSCAAPLWAGLAALMNEQAVGTGRPTIGFVNPAIYAIGQGAEYGTTFHDITVGNNFWPHSPSLFSAANGYDLCTGWGSPAGQPLIDAVAGPADSLSVSPFTGFTAYGAVGGPFSPTNLVFQLTNTSATSLTWSLLNSSSWLMASSTNGVLAAGATTAVTVGLSPAAYGLGAAAYSANLIFTNRNTQAARTVTFSLNPGLSIVQNGGFETGDFSYWTLSGHGLLLTNIDGQSQLEIYNAVEPAIDYPLVAHSGNFGAFLGDTAPAKLSQTLPTIAGQYYWISLWLDNPTNGTGQSFYVNWNTNATTHTLYTKSSPPVFAWTNLQFIAAAGSSSTVIQFQAENIPNFYGLDDVSVTPIPKPAFTGVALTPQGVNLSWIATSGLVYQVQYNPAPIQTGWLNLGAPTTATSSPITFSDTNSISAALERYYRLKLSP
jgi:subtilase family serine protease